jgi:hypothetical protein
MQTTPHIAASLVVALAVALGTGARPTSAAHHNPISVTVTVTPPQTRSLGNRKPVDARYGWPLKPFNRQHPVRAFLDDPRIGRHGSRAFHFGIDISAPDGTHVYAVTGGILYLERGWLSVDSGGRHEFGYWHITPNPQLREHQIVHRHQLLGTIAAPWGHVHFAERIGDDYVNPLRPGGLGPYSDPVAPSIDGVSATRKPDGTISLVASAHDTTWPRVAAPWTNEPVTPALLRWRVYPTGGHADAWHTAADFRQRMLDRKLFSSIYAPATTQNHELRPATYAFYLSAHWHPADGAYRVEVEATDTRGNSAVATAAITVASGRPRAS